MHFWLFFLGQVNSPCLGQQLGENVIPRNMDLVKKKKRKDPLATRNNLIQTTLWKVWDKFEDKVGFQIPLLTSIMFSPNCRIAHKLGHFDPGIRSNCPRIVGFEFT